MKKKTYNGEKRLFGPLQATACLREKDILHWQCIFSLFFSPGQGEGQGAWRRQRLGHSWLTWQLTRGSSLTGNVYCVGVFIGPSSVVQSPTCEKDHKWITEFTVMSWNRWLGFTWAVLAAGPAGGFRWLFEGF